MSSIKKNKLEIKNSQINWICLGSECKNNCCGENSYVRGRIIQDNLKPLIDIPKNTIPVTDKNCEFLKKYNKNNFINLGHGGIHIKQTDKGGCIFLEPDGKCAIYNERSSSCRSYPFFFDKYTGLCIDISCPGIGKGWTPLTQIIIMVDELKKVYEHQFNLADLFFESSC